MTSSTDEVGATPEQVVSEACAVTLPEAVRLSGRSVQAVRQRIVRDTAQGWELHSGSATVVGIELNELVRAFGQLSEPDEVEARVRGRTAKRDDEPLVLTAKAEAAQDPAFGARVADFLKPNAT